MLKIVAHTLIRNEERFIWYALSSVLPQIDRVMVWDTGSTDRTAEMVKSISSPKIQFKQVGEVDARAHTALRQRMLQETAGRFDWLMLLDGDEVWPTESLRQVRKKLATDGQVRAVVVRTRNWVGDVYHYQRPWAGHYYLAGERGHLALRFIDLRLPQLTVIHPHGGQTYTTTGTPVQTLVAPALQLVDTYYYHATHLSRSTADSRTLKRRQKYKLELGLPAGTGELPTVLFGPRPEVVPDVTAPMSKLTWAKAALLTGPRLVRRRLKWWREGY